MKANNILKLKRKLLYNFLLYKGVVSHRFATVSPEEKANTEESHHFTGHIRLKVLLGTVCDVLTEVLKKKGICGASESTVNRNGTKAPWQPSQPLVPNVTD